MSDWAEASDPKSGRKYYYNRKTKETRWTRPTEMDGGASESDSAASDPNNWCASNDKSSGRKYYYNKVTKETRWTKPPCFGDDQDAPMLERSNSVSSIASSVADEEVDLGDPSKWRKVVDKRTGRPYYYNPETKQTSWKKPRGFVEGNTARHGDTDTSLGKSFGASSRFKTDDEDGDSDASGNEDIDNGDDDEDDEILKKGRKLLDDDEEGSVSVGEGNKFRFAKHRKGWLNRTFHLGGAFDEKTLLSFKKSLIKKSLLKQNREYDAEAVQAFKNLMSYMGDRRSHKSDIGHAKKLISNGLTAPETLRDEMYLQICKQVTQHPNLQHAIKGWELMCIYLGCFPPSVTMKTFLVDFIEKVKTDDSTDAEVRRISKICLERLDKILLLGPRTEVPSTNEIKRDQAGSPVALKVFLLNNSFRTVDADCFTLVKEVKRAVVQKLGLGYSVPFSLYEFSRDAEERILDEDVRILDVVSAWERIAKEKKLADLEPFRLVFKAELVLKTSDKNLIEDEEALDLMFIQAVHDVVNERYPAEVKDCPSLAALHLQASFGDYQPDMHTIDWISDRLKELIPAVILNGGKKKNNSALAEFAQKVLTKYTKLAGVSEQEAKLSYLDYVQDWPLYGASFVTVEQKQLKDYPPYIRVAITCDDVLLVHPETKDVLDQFGYHEIVTWGYSDEKFILVVGNLVQQRKLFFKTNRGKFMNKLVHDYVKTKVPQA